MKTVSVIIPVYNVEKWLRKCVDSVINQTYKQLQIILVDDGSTDGSGIICDEYKLVDTRINVIHAENKGSVVARKEGLSIADGTYIGVVDGDDYILPQMYEHLVNEMNKRNVDIVHCGYFELSNCGKKEKISIKGRNYELTSLQKKEAFLADVFFKSIKGECITPSIWSKLYKSEIIKKAFLRVPDEQQYGEDVLSLIYCVYAAKSIGLVSESLYIYRIRPDSMSHINNYKRIINYVELSHNIMATIKELNRGKLICGSEKFIIDSFFSTVNTVEPESIIHFIRNPQILFNKKVAMYGAGAIGQDCYKQLKWYDQIEVVGIFDQNFHKIKLPYTTVREPDELPNFEFDVLIITVVNDKAVSEIKQKAALLGVSKKKIAYYNKTSKNIIFEPNKILGK